MKHGFRLWLFLSLVLLAPIPALANWPMSGGLGLPIATGPDDQVCKGICTDGSGGSIVLIQAPAMTAQRIDRLGRLVWAPEGIVLSPAGGPTANTGASIASDGNGGAFAAWVVAGQASYPLYTKLRLQRVRADGTLLTLYGTDVSGTDGTSYDSPGLIPDGAGGVFLAWLGPRTSTTSEVYVQRIDASGTLLWSEPSRVSQGDLSRVGPSYASDGAGGIVIAWKEPGQTSTAVLAQRIDGSGTARWGSDGIVLSASGPYNGAIAVGDDGQGAFVVAWPGVQDLRAQKIDAAGVPEWADGGVTVANVATESASDVIADDEGGVYIGMVRRGAASLDLFVQHLDADGVALWDPAGLCVGEERISSAGYLNRFWLQLVVDGEGGTIAAWSEFAEPPLDNDTDCRAQRFDSAGNRLWGSFGAVVSTAPQSQDMPFMIPDGKAGATVAWTQGPGMTTIGTDVYGQHINRQGKLGTPAPPKASSAPVEARLSLQSVRPNPMSDVSTIGFSIAVASRVRVSLLDVSGHRVRVLFDGPMEAGAHEMRLDTRSGGSRLPSGLYFVSVDDGRERRTRRIVVY